MLFEHILPALRAGRTVRQATMPRDHGVKWASLPDGRPTLVLITPLGETNYNINVRAIVLAEDWEVTGDDGKEARQGQATAVAAR